MNQKHYSPIYWLASLGFGGVLVTFFLLLHFNVPHPNTPVPTAEQTYAFLQKDENGLKQVARNVIASKMMAKKKAELHVATLPEKMVNVIKQKAASNPAKIDKVASVLAIQQKVAWVGVIGVVISALLHFRLLFWNLNQFFRYIKTPEYRELKNSIREVSLMSIPLTLAMSIKVVMLGGAALIPGFFSDAAWWWGFGAYLLVAAYAVYLFGEYFSRILDEGSHEFIENNNLGQMIAIFAFAMISVGLIGPAAMSNDPVLSKWSFLIAISFGAISLLLAFLKFGNSMMPIFQKGVSANGSVSLLIIVPILTLFGVWGILRLDHGLHHAFHSGISPSLMLSSLTIIFALELAFMLIGFRMMFKKNYFSRFIFGDKEVDSSAFAIICPLVAFYVWGMFFLHAGLVKTGMVDKWSLLYALIYGFFAFVQIVMLVFYFQLNKKLLGSALTFLPINLKAQNIVEEDVTYVKEQLAGVAVKSS